MFSRRSFNLGIGASVAAAAAPIRATPTPHAAIQQRINAYMLPLIRSSAFDGVVLISQGSHILYELYVGRVSLISRDESDSKTSFLVASISKQFTAAAIERLRLTGRLSLDDSVARHLPGFPYGDRVTIRHLVTHKSGYAAEPPSTGWRNAPHTRETLQKFLGGQPLAFAPGSDTRYSNEGYTTLAFIIEAASGMPYGEYLRENFFHSLGMTSARDYLDDGRPARFAEPRTFGPPPSGRRVLDPKFGTTYKGASTIVLTARDLNRWTRQFGSGRFGTLGEDNGSLARWRIRNFEGHRALQSDGYTPGTSASVSYFPDQDLSVIMIASIDNRSWGRWGDDLAAIALGREVDNPPLKRPPLRGNPRDAAAVAGTYQIESPIDPKNPEPAVRIARENGGIYLYTAGWLVPQFLNPIGKDAYGIRGFYPGEVIFLHERGKVAVMKWMRPAHFAPGMEERQEYVYRRMGSASM